MSIAFFVHNTAPEICFKVTIPIANRNVDGECIHYAFQLIHVFAGGVHIGKRFSATRCMDGAMLV